MKPLSKQQEDILRDCYSKTSVKELALQLGKSPNAVYELARKRGYKKMQRWTRREQNVILRKGINKGSKKLNRSYNACKVNHCRQNKELAHNREMMNGYLKIAYKNIMGRCFNLCLYPDEAKDLFQEVILYVHSLNIEFKSVYHYSRYCYKVAECKLINLRKKQNVRQNAMYDASNVEFVTPLHYCYFNDLFSLIENACLSDNERMVLNYSIEGFEPPEIASHENMSLGSVYNIKYNAVNKLRHNRLINDYL